MTATPGDYKIKLDEAMEIHAKAAPHPDCTLCHGTGEYTEKHDVAIFETLDCPCVYRDTDDDAVQPEQEKVEEESK